MTCCLMLFFVVGVVCFFQHKLPRIIHKFWCTPIHDQLYGNYMFTMLFKVEVLARLLSKLPNSLTP